MFSLSRACISRILKRPLLPALLAGVSLLLASCTGAQSSDITPTTPATAAYAASGSRPSDSGPSDIPILVKQREAAPTQLPEPPAELHTGLFIAEKSDGKTVALRLGEYQTYGFLSPLSAEPVVGDYVVRGDELLLHNFQVTYAFKILSPEKIRLSLEASTVGRVSEGFSEQLKSLDGLVFERSTGRDSVLAEPRPRLIRLRDGLYRELTVEPEYTPRCCLEKGPLTFSSDTVPQETNTTNIRGATGWQLWDNGEVMVFMEHDKRRIFVKAEN